MSNKSDNNSSNFVQSFGDILLSRSFDDPQQKSDYKYGQKLLTRIFREQSNDMVGFYFGQRNILWLENYRWATGIQSMKEFIDYVSTDGNKAYTNVDLTPNRVGVKLVDVLINSMSQNEEYPCVTAIDDGSISEKQTRKNEALFRMRHVQQINQMQQSAGLQFEPEDVYVPDDPLSAEVYFKLEDRLPKEILFEEKLNKIMLDNDYSELKRQLIKDLIVFNFSCTKLEKDENGFKTIRKCVAPNMMYNFFMSDSGKRELGYIGEMYNLKITDLRKKFGQSKDNPKGMSEKDIFEMAKNATQFNTSNRFIYNWTDTYMYATDRPYDDYSIQVFDCEVRMYDADYYVNKKDSFGKDNIQPKSNIPKPTSDKATVVKSDKITWYRGIWAVKADRMIYWGNPDITIRPFMDIAECLSSYTVNIPNNTGDYVPSLFERILEPLREYTLCKLKRKQLVANMRASGISIDTEIIRDVDLGGGNVIDGMEVIKIYNQTGNLVWNSRGLDPSEQQRKPIEEMPNAGSIAQLNELTNIMVSCYGEMRDLIGVSIYLDGGQVGDRTAATLAEGQVKNATNVSQHIYNGFTALLKETLYKACIMEWDEVVLSKNADGSELMDTVFQISVELKETAYEKQQIEAMIAVAMKSVDATGQPLLSFKDAFKIRNIKNFKLAEMYLSNMVEQNKKHAEQVAQQNSQQNAQAQQQSAAQAAQQAQQLAEQQAQLESAQKDVDLKREKEKILLQGVVGIYESAIKAGTGIPDELKPLFTQVISNVSMPLVMENKGIQAQMLSQAAHIYATKTAMQDQQAAQQQQGGQQPDPNQQQPQGQPDNSQTQAA